MVAVRRAGGAVLRRLPAHENKWEFPSLDRKTRQIRDVSDVFLRRLGRLRESIERAFTLRMRG